MRHPSTSHMTETIFVPKYFFHSWIVEIFNQWLWRVGIWKGILSCAIAVTNPNYRNGVALPIPHSWCLCANYKIQILWRNINILGDLTNNISVSQGSFSYNLLVYLSKPLWGFTKTLSMILHNINFIQKLLCNWQTNHG